MSMPPAGPPAGWYADPQDGNTQRWWDGQSWTDDVLPHSGEAQTATAVAGRSAPAGATSGRRWALAAGAVLLAVLVAGAAWWAHGQFGPSADQEPVPPTEADADADADTDADAAPDTDADTDAGATGDGTSSPDPPDGDEEASTPATDGRSWSRVTDEDSIVGPDGSHATMMSVVAGGPGLVVVGYDEDRQSAAVWTSTDGEAWSRVEHDEAIFGGEGSQEMHKVVAGGPGLVAVGRDEGRQSAAVWTSTDGEAWSRVEHDEAIFGGEDEQHMHAVSAGGPGLVAVGHDAGRSAAAVWLSDDGESWMRVQHDDAAFGEPGSWTKSMYAVTAGGPGLVAVGIDYSGRGIGAWTSTDGQVWARVARDDTDFGNNLDWMFSVVAADAGLVAVGARDDAEYSPTAWTLSDGEVWSRTQEESIQGGDVSQPMYSVTEGGPGLVAVGTDWERDQAMVWTSADGMNWTAVDASGTTFGGEGSPGMNSVTVGGPGLVAVGVDDLDGRRQAAVWTSP